MRSVFISRRCSARTPLGIPQRKSSGTARFRTSCSRPWTPGDGETVALELQTTSAYSRLKLTPLLLARQDCCGRGAISGKTRRPPKDLQVSGISSLSPLFKVAGPNARPSNLVPNCGGLLTHPPFVLAAIHAKLPLRHTARVL